MSARPPSRRPTRFERLLAHPSTQPLLHVARRTLPIEAANKREREVIPHPLDGFDPTQDPEGCLRRFHAVWLAVKRWPDPAEQTAARRRLESAEPLLMDFVRDQAEICTVHGDCETTDLIRHGTPIGGMTISVASLLFVEDGGTNMLLSFWSDPSLGRGAPLRFFRHALEHAKRLVFYNAAFDLALAARGDGATIHRWAQRRRDAPRRPRPHEGVRPLPRRAPTRAPCLLPRVRAPLSEVTTIGTVPRPVEGGEALASVALCTRGKTGVLVASTTLGLEAVTCSSDTQSDTLRCNAYLPSSTPAYPSTCPVPAPSVQHSMEGHGELLAKRALSDNQPGELAVLRRHQLTKCGVRA